ncbi:MAG: ornithine carbamoyltransferase [Planctomycetes bacterium]|nr:ornithine carbamoyltransferase [Planctomycetota bacterium]
MTHFIDIADHSPQWLQHVLDVGVKLRKQRAEAGVNDPLLRGKSMAMIFEKPSLRTRVSFELAVTELGGHAVPLSNQEIGLGKRESPEDVARVLSGMVHAIMARVAEHAKLLSMAEHASVPVINALSDDSHPCQALADVMTLIDEFGPDLAGRTVAFVGDGNNVALSLAELCVKLGVNFTLAAPRDYSFSDAAIARIERQAAGGKLIVTEDPFQAAKGADALYADTFVSMGQEEEKAARLKVFAPYQINNQLIAAAAPHAVVLHCLPAYRGIEITDAAMDGPPSRVFPQAHNRLHAQKGLLAVLLAGL